ncbi:MAG TPA: hypothetical protein VJ369_00510, partial [Glutamicibacter sp.]|nr:hypothetical protein [Glutamicibacter sp.]
QSIRVLQQIDAPHPSLRTLFRSLGTCIDKDYRDQLAKAMVAYRAATAGLASLVMYDVTTLLCRHRHNNVVTSYMIIAPSPTDRLR